jgi:hypothetical protein
MASAAAAYTASGFGQVVQALSMYIKPLFKAARSPYRVSDE